MSHKYIMVSNKITEVNTLKELKLKTYTLITCKLNIKQPSRYGVIRKLCRTELLLSINKTYSN